jgi:hypothetical protein
MSTSTGRFGWDALVIKTRASQRPVDLNTHHTPIRAAS